MNRYTHPQERSLSERYAIENKSLRLLHLITLAQPLTTPPSPTPSPHPKHILPITQRPRFLPSPARPRPLISIPTLDTPTSIIPAQIPILYPTRRVIWIDFAEFNLGQDHARKPIKQLLYILAIQRRHLDRNRNAILACPARRRFSGDFAAVGRNGIRGVEICAQRGRARRLRAGGGGVEPALGRWRAAVAAECAVA